MMLLILLINCREKRGTFLMRRRFPTTSDEEVEEADESVSAVEEDTNNLKRADSHDEDADSFQEFAEPMTLAQMLQPPSASPLSTSWRPSVYPDLYAVTADGATATYKGTGGRIGDNVDIFYGVAVGKVSLTRSNPCYFEIDIALNDQCPNQACSICIGITANHASAIRTSLLNSTVSCVLYNGSNGSVYVDGAPQSRSFGDGKYTHGDTIGCGVDFEKRKVYFSKNGEIISTVTHASNDVPWFPVVSLRRPGDEVTFRSKTMLQISSQLKITNFKNKIIDHNTMCGLLAEYFTQHSLGGTMDVFKKEVIGENFDFKSENFATKLISEQQTSQQKKTKPWIVSLAKRSKLRTFVMNGEYDKVQIKLKKYVPDSISKTLFEQRVFKDLKVLQFVELVKSNSLLKAIDFAKSEPSISHQVIPMLAYANLGDSPYCHLLTERHRCHVADCLNSEILLKIGTEKMKDESSSSDSSSDVLSPEEPTVIDILFHHFITCKKLYES